MSYQVLARKWRPARFEQLVGQEHVVQALVNALDGDRLHHAYLFSGTRGVGKTTVARIFAKSLNCEQGIGSSPCGECSSCREIDEGRSVDLIEIDAASRTGVDDMRELLENVQYAPTRSRFKIYLIDEVHMLSRHSFNALLKTLEEPPPHIKFLLATTDPQKIPVTVLSRCLQFSLKRMSREQIRAQLAFLTEQEGIEADAAALAQLASAADGSMRDALSLLDQAIGYGAGAVRQDSVEAMLGAISRDHLIRLFDALAAEDAATILREARAVIEFNPDYLRVCAEMITLLQQVALYQAEPRLADTDEFDAELLQRFATRWAPEEVQLFYQILLQGRQDLLISPDQSVGFEMLMLRLLAFAPEVSAVEPADGVKKKPESAGGVARAARAEPNEIPAVEPAAAAAADAPSTADESDAPPTTDESDAPSTTDKSDAALDWSALAYQLELGGLAQEIVANSSLQSYRDGKIRLLLRPEIHELATDLIRTEISQALERKLALSLRLELVSDPMASQQTPVEARRLREQRERQAAIDAIREEQTVKKLGRALSAELDEASVIKIDASVNR